MGDSNRFGGSCVVHGSTEGGGGGLAGADEEILSPVPEPPPGFSHSACPPEVHRTCFCVRFIAEHTRMLEESTKVGINIELALYLQYMVIIVLKQNYSQSKYILHN
jgi:hypothetical protein